MSGTGRRHGPYFGDGSVRSPRRDPFVSEEEERTERDPGGLWSTFRLPWVCGT